MAWKKKNKKNSDELDLSLEGTQVPEMPTVGEVVDSIESVDSEPVDTGIKFTDPSEVVEQPEPEVAEELPAEPVNVQEVKPVVQPIPQVAQPVVQKPKVVATKTLNDGWKKFFPGLK